MTTPGGGFAASLDADSEGEEGKFYVWTAGEITDILGAGDAAVFGKVYGVTPGGNFEGHTILNRLDHLGLLSEEDERRLAGYARPSCSPVARHGYGPGSTTRCWQTGMV